MTSVISSGVTDASGQKSPLLAQRAREKWGTRVLTFSISDNTGCLDFARNDERDAAGARGLTRIDRLDKLRERHLAGRFQNNDPPSAIVEELGQTALQR